MFKACSAILIACTASLSAYSQDAASIRSDFLKTIDRPRVPLNPKLQPAGASRGLTATHFTFATGADETVPGIIIRLEKTAGRRPAVIVLHGTGDSKEGMSDLAS